jgi:hypothetical protein
MQPVEQFLVAVGAAEWYLMWENTRDIGMSKDQP